MKQILKRLELISSAIAIEEEEIIELQIGKLCELNLDDEAQAIVTMVQNHHYEEVIGSITSYIHRFSGVTVYEDPAVQGLKVELRALEKEMSRYSELKNECMSEINTFNAAYYKHLGAIVEEILRLKRELAQKAFERGEMGEEERKSYEEQYRSFNEEAMSQAKEEVMGLNVEEEKELKKLYRKASRLTHPDIVADLFKDEASEIFVALNAAYKKKDLSKVKEILAGLESGVNFTYASEEIDNKELLRHKAQTLRTKIDALKAEIAQQQESEAYMTMQETEDLDAYFEEVRKALTLEKEEIYLELLKVKKAEKE